MVDRAPLRLLAASTLIPLLLAFALTIFAWPAAHLQPRDLPIGLVGRAHATSAIVARLQAATASGFHFQEYSDEAHARAAIAHRDVYGALVVDGSGTTLLVASAAGPMVAQLLTQAVTTGATARASNRPPRVIDVVSVPAKDPRGAAFSSSVLPLVLSGLIAGILITFISTLALFRALALLTSAVLAGFVADGIVQGWLGVLQGSWLANSGVLMLILLAISAAVVGLRSLLGYPGLALGALLMMFVGNSLSGITSAPELLPKPWGAFGQLLPPGAGGNLLRSTAFFGGSGAGGHLVVLVVWTLCGYAAIAIAARRQARAKGAAVSIIELSEDSVVVGCVTVR